MSIQSSSLCCAAVPRARLRTLLSGRDGGRHDS